MSAESGAATPVRIPAQRGADRSQPCIAALDPKSDSGLDPGGEPNRAHGLLAKTTLVAPRVDLVSIVRATWHRPRLLLALQVLAMIGVGGVAAVALEAEPAVAATVLLLCLLTTFHGGRAAQLPGRPSPERLASDAAFPIAALAVAVALTGLGTQSLRASVVLVLLVSGCGAAGTLLRSRLQRPVRVIVVGSSSAIATAAARWHGSRRVNVVGGLLIDDAQDTPPVTTLRVRTACGVDQVVEWVDLWAADLVVVTPGPGVDSDSVRRLSWLLERTHAALAVVGVLDSFAPHRISTTSLAGTTLIHAGSSRPPTLVRGVKWVVDRLGGLAALMVVSPVLAVLWLVIRLESPGPGFFTQTRIGKDGRPFTMYKLRTMHCGAEARQAVVADLDEGNGVLFKVRRDPRVTASGHVLRKTSLDELPQLVNVVRGHMSLVGPRPALPNEVAGYDACTRRRLAVRPGITGLWQVSGRSDLSWEHSVELDLTYTDNYRLAGDLAIGLRTVDAVVRARGAY